jgi:hypothetical protein
MLRLLLALVVALRAQAFCPPVYVPTRVVLPDPSNASGVLVFNASSGTVDVLPDGVSESILPFFLPVRNSLGLVEGCLGPQGRPGPTGGSITVSFNFSLSLSPAAGRLSFDAPMPSTSMITVSDSDAYGQNWSSVFSSVFFESTSQVKGLVRLATANTTTNTDPSPTPKEHAVFLVTQVAANASSSSHVLSVTTVSNFSSFSNGEPLVLFFDVYGNKGAAGAAGSNGTDGAQGANGTVGATGAPGSKGDMGLNGTNGTPGQQGPPGINGTNGAPGAMGDTGPQGSPGFNGSTGPVGAPGPAGTAGADAYNGSTGQQGAAGTNGLNAGFFPPTYNNELQTVVMSGNGANSFGNIAMTANTISVFNLANAWSGTNGIVTQGLLFDGRYLYLGTLTSFNTALIRYDTTANFSDSSSYQSMDVNAFVASSSQSYSGGAFDGRYIYFTPDLQAADPTSVLRYDTTASFIDSSSYLENSVQFYPSEGFNGALYDGHRYLYFIPAELVSSSTVFIQFDTLGNFSATASSSWVYSTITIAKGGYLSAVYDGRYVYYSPNPTATSNPPFLRFDTTFPFISSFAPPVWTTFNISLLTSSNTGYVSSVYDGRYVYLAPYNTFPLLTNSGKLIRYDTSASFTATSSYSVFDTTTLNPLCKGYQGSFFDGRFVFFTPFFTVNPSQKNNLLVRYDTARPFTLTSSYTVLNLSSVSSAATALAGGAFDGRYGYVAAGANNGQQLLVRIAVDTGPPLPAVLSSSVMTPSVFSVLVDTSLSLLPISTNIELAGAFDAGGGTLRGNDLSFNATSGYVTVLKDGLFSVAASGQWLSGSSTGCARTVALGVVGAAAPFCSFSVTQPSSTTYWALTQGRIKLQLNQQIHLFAQQTCTSGATESITGSSQQAFSVTSVSQ